MIDASVPKPLLVLHGEIKTPPFSTEARKWAGTLLRQLQLGQPLIMPDSKPMPAIGARCHELRVKDAESKIAWRVIYRIDADAIVVVDVFAKKTQKTPNKVIDRCRARLTKYDQEKDHK